MPQQADVPAVSTQPDAGSDAAHTANRAGRRRCGSAPPKGRLVSVADPCGLRKSSVSPQALPSRTLMRSRAARPGLKPALPLGEEALYEGDHPAAGHPERAGHHAWTGPTKPPRPPAGGMPIAHPSTQGVNDARGQVRTRSANTDPAGRAGRHGVGSFACRSGDEDAPQTLTREKPPS